MEPFIITPRFGMSPSEDVISEEITVVISDPTVILVSVSCSVGASLLINGVLISDKATLVSAGKTVALYVKAPDTADKSFVENLYIDDQFDTFLVSTFTTGGSYTESENAVTLDPNTPPISLKEDLIFIRESNALNPVITDPLLISGIYAANDSYLVEGDTAAYINPAFNWYNAIYRVEYITNKLFNITVSGLSVQNYYETIDYTKRVILKDGSLAKDNTGTEITYTPQYDRPLTNTKQTVSLVDGNLEYNIQALDANGSGLTDILLLIQELNTTITNVPLFCTDDDDLSSVATTNTIYVDANNDPAIDCLALYQTDDGKLLTISGVSDNDSDIIVLSLSTPVLPCSLANIPVAGCLDTLLCYTDPAMLLSEEPLYTKTVIQHINSGYIPVLIPDFHNRIIYRYDGIYQSVVEVVTTKDKAYRAQYLAQVVSADPLVPPYFITSGYYTGITIYKPDTNNPKVSYSYDRSESCTTYCYIEHYTLKLPSGGFDLIIDELTRKIYVTGFTLGHVYLVEYDLTDTAQPLRLTQTLSLNDKIHSVCDVKNRNEIWVTGYNKFKIYVIDKTTLSLKTTIDTVGYPSGIAYDEVSLQTWVSLTSRQSIIAYNNSYTQTQSVDLSVYANTVVPVDLAYDKDTRQVLVSDYFGHHFFTISTASLEVTVFKPNKTPIGFSRELETNTIYMYSLYGDLYGGLTLDLLYHPSDFVDLVDCDIDTYVESNSIEIQSAPPNSKVVLQPDSSTIFLVKNGVVTTDRFVDIQSGDFISLLVKTDINYEKETITHTAFNGYLLDFSVKTLKRSYIYDGLVFNPVYDAELTTNYISNIETIEFSSDITTVDPAYTERLVVQYFSDVPGELKINGIVEPSNDVYVKHGDTIQLSLTSSIDYTTDVYALVIIGAYKSPYLVKTKQLVTGQCVDNPIVFVDLYQIELLTVVQSNVVSYTPVVNTKIYLNNEFRSVLYVNGNEITYGHLSAGITYSIYLELRTLPNNSLDHILTLNLESTCDHNTGSKLWWKVRTIDDVEIDPLYFIDVYNADLPYVEYTSNTETITGIPVGVVLPVYLTEGILIINGVEVNSYVNENTQVGTVKLGDTVAIKIVTFFPMVTKFTYTLTVGETHPVSADWNVTTRMLEPYVDDLIGKATRKDTDPEIHRIDKIFTVISTSLFIASGLSPYYNNSNSTITVSEYTSGVGMTDRKIPVIASTLNKDIISKSFSLTVIDWDPATIKTLTTKLTVHELKLSPIVIDRYKQYTDLSVVNNVITKSSTQYTDLSIIDNVITKSSTQYTDLSVVDNVITKSSTQYTDLSVVDNVVIKSSTQYVVHYADGAYKIQKMLITADSILNNPIVSYSDTILTVIMYNDSLSINRVIYTAFQQDASVTKTDNTYLFKMSSILDSLDNNQRSIITNLKALPALVDSLRVTDTVLGLVIPEVRLRLMATLDNAVRNVIFTIFTGSIIKPALNEVVSRLSVLFAATSCSAYVASEAQQKADYTHQYHLTSQLTGATTLGYNQHISDPRLATYLNIFYSDKQSTADYLNLFHLTEQSTADYLNLFHLTEQSTADYLNLFHLTDQLPPDYLNLFHLTEQLPPDYLNLFHLTEQLPPDYLNLFHLTEQLPPKYHNRLYLTDQLPADHLSDFKLSEITQPEYINKLWLTDMYNPVAITSMWLAALRLPFSLRANHVVEYLKPVFLSDTKFAKIIKPVFLSSTRTTTNLIPIRHLIEGLKLSHIIHPINPPNRLYYVKLLNYIKRPNKFVVKDVKTEYKFVKGGFPANITEYDCESAAYFATPEDAKAAALLAGHEEAVIVVSSISDDCYVWGTVKEPSTACPEDDYTRGYVHGG